MTDPVDPPVNQSAAPVEPAATAPAKKPRSLLLKVFGISPWGALKLIGLCVLVGFFVMASNFNPSNPDTDIVGALASVLRQALAATGWMIRNFWKPALAGATVVLPLWIVWRVISAPFRK